MNVETLAGLEGSENFRNRLTAVIQVPGFGGRKIPTGIGKRRFQQGLAVVMSFAADGLFVDSGLFHVMPEVSLAPLDELFRTRVITFLVKRGLLPQGRAGTRRAGHRTLARRSIPRLRQRTGVRAKLRTPVAARWAREARIFGPPACRTRHFVMRGASRITKRAIDSQTPICRHPAMETPASNSRPTPRKAGKRFPIKGWKSNDLKYYWEKVPLSIVPWEASYIEPSARIC